MFKKQKKDIKTFYAFGFKNVPKRDASAHYDLRTTDEKVKSRIASEMIKSYITDEDSNNEAVREHIQRYADQLADLILTNMPPEISENMDEIINNEPLSPINIPLHSSHITLEDLLKEEVHKIPGINRNIFEIIARELCH